MRFELIRIDWQGEGRVEGFLRFRVHGQDNRAGIYTFSVNGEVTYVGQTFSLGRRVNDGYGNIAPANILPNGRRTNVRVNRLIREAGVENVELRFSECENRVEVEREMINSLSPRWNRA
jgi:hypothetical protein